MREAHVIEQKATWWWRRARSRLADAYTFVASKSIQNFFFRISYCRRIACFTVCSSANTIRFNFNTTKQPNNQATAATATESVKRNKKKKLWLHAVRRFFKLSIDCNKSNKKIKTNLMLTFDIFNPIRFFLIRILEFKLSNFHAYS